MEIPADSHQPRLLLCDHDERRRRRRLIPSVEPTTAGGSLEVTLRVGGADVAHRGPLSDCDRCTYLSRLLEVLTLAARAAAHPGRVAAVEPSGTATPSTTGS
ncbi:hypothetical protein [Streptomyces sp. NPDC093984]|uniref:hypothetical protein n=1 Tax=Streptomyces sp. NPDC093984 TaxID=3366052 RepID=UPI003817D5BE